MQFGFCYFIAMQIKFNILIYFQQKKIIIRQIFNSMLLGSYQHVHVSSPLNIFVNQRRKLAQ